MLKSPQYPLFIHNGQIFFSRTFDPVNIDIMDTDIAIYKRMIDSEIYYVVFLHPVVKSTYILITPNNKIKIIAREHAIKFKNLPILDTTEFFAANDLLKSLIKKILNKNKIAVHNLYQNGGSEYNGILKLIYTKKPLQRK